MVVSEVSRMIGSWKSKHPEAKIDGVLLSGGTAGFVGLAEYLGSKFGLPASVGDPWRSIIVPEALRPKVLDMGPAFSACLGLAIHGLEMKK
jgi:Tfp pilus assembly PilM family ATPase